MARTKILISYSHQDERWRQRLMEQLDVLAQSGLVEVWADRQIGVGERWRERIDQAMLEARIAVLLLSAAFLTSQFIVNMEVPRLLRAHEAAGMTIYPLLIRPCRSQVVPWLSGLQLRPPDARAIAALTGSRRHEALADVAREIAAIARREPLEDTLATSA